MITLVEALNYRCLKYVSRPLQPFHVLVGPNASGKTTFMDAVSFLSDLLLHGLEGAILKRTSNPHDLLFQHQGHTFELAVEATIPNELLEKTIRPDLNTIRYEITLGFDDSSPDFEIRAERVLLKRSNSEHEDQPSLFPAVRKAPDTLVLNSSRNTKYVISKVPGGNDNFYSEIYRKSGKGWTPSFQLGPKRSALRNMPADERRFPVTTWFRDYMQTGVQHLALSSRRISKPSPPLNVTTLALDGSNVPWIIARMRDHDRENHRAWIKHLQTALPDLTDIKTIERPEDRHCYMVYEYSNGLNLPSWVVSDGTLRLTALTLPAYLVELTGTFLIEEPENGIHPRAVATAYESLSSLYDAQVLLASHSPIVLSEAVINEVLCFARDEQGATDVVLGSEHPALRNWQDDTDLGMLLASGVLG